MLALEKTGCENINFVTPTHQAPWILEAVIKARQSGLTCPIVYNCGGYESTEALKLLDGFIDIYMPDIKFFDADLARQLLGLEDYPHVVRKAVTEMHRQVGDLRITNGRAVGGLLVRHLVMPNAVEDGKQIIDFVADEVSANTYTNVMTQSRPCHQADHYPQIARPTRLDEWRCVYDHALDRGLRPAN